MHTHLSGEELTQDDLTDLALLRLDLMAAVQVDADGLPGTLTAAYLLPAHMESGPEDSLRGPDEFLSSTDAGEANKPARPTPFGVLGPVHPGQLDTDFIAFITSLEEEMARARRVRSPRDKRERAILVGVTSGSRLQAQESLDELKELARSGEVVVLDTIVQHRNRLDPRSLIGRGKLQELIIRSLQLGADVIIFDQELTTSQARIIGDATDLKIIDRTQLILDIFAQRARSREGKIQVELAQLKYMLPRLTGSGSEMSRLMGGIGGRGPGETKLEVDRRRVRDRIHQLEKEIGRIRTSRQVRRTRRQRRDVAILSLVGYTNSGKSTLLNSLTNSAVVAEDLMFATLDPTSRRLRLPRDREVIINDTVGFIRDLPPDLIEAFRATLEELEESDLLVHVVDISNPHFESHISAVEKILADLRLASIPRIMVFNKADLLPADEAANLGRAFGATVVSAINSATLLPLVERAAAALAGVAQRVPGLEREFEAEGAGVEQGVGGWTPEVNDLAEPTRLLSE
ncbi:MAG TPA: GTPase HflX [Blastocatellia bacterium]